MYVKTSAEARQQQIDLIKDLPQPFTPIRFFEATGKPRNAAASMFRRWLNWGWIEKTSYGEYVRTAAFGERATPRHPAPSAELAPRTEVTTPRILTLQTGVQKWDDREAEGKSDEWLMENYKHFHTQSKFYKKGWFLKNKTKVSRYKKTQKAREALAAKQAAANGTGHPEHQQSEVVSCKLTECPNCGTRFYMAKGGVA